MTDFSSMVGTFWPLGLLAIAYFLMIRPQKVRQKKMTAMQNELKKGDRIITSSGILGTISLVKEQTVKLNVAENVEIEIYRSAVLQLQDSADQ